MRLIPPRVILLLGLSACSGSAADPGVGQDVDETHAAAQSLKLWMSANASPALKSANYEKLSRVFRRAATFAPAGAEFSTWEGIADAGAEAADRGDLDGVRSACQSCHQSHRAAYRAAHRGR